MGYPALDARLKTGHDHDLERERERERENGPARNRKVTKKEDPLREGVSNPFPNVSGLGT